MSLLLGHSLTRDAAVFCLDSELAPVFKECWCKKGPPTQELFASYKMQPALPRSDRKSGGGGGSGGGSGSSSSSSASGVQTSSHGAGASASPRSGGGSGGGGGAGSGNSSSSAPACQDPAALEVLVRAADRLGALLQNHHQVQCATVCHGGLHCLVLLPCTALYCLELPCTVLYCTALSRAGGEGHKAGRAGFRADTVTSLPSCLPPSSLNTGIPAQ